MSYGTEMCNHPGYEKLQRQYEEADARDAWVEAHAEYWKETIRTWTGAELAVELTDAIGITVISDAAKDNLAYNARLYATARQAIDMLAGYPQLETPYALWEEQYITDRVNAALETLDWRTIDPMTGETHA